MRKIDINPNFKNIRDMIDSNPMDTDIEIRKKIENYFPNIKKEFLFIFINFSYEKIKSKKCHI